MNTVYLWGQGVRQVALSLSCAFAITNEGLGYVWGGVNKWWSNTEEFNPVPIDTNEVRLSHRNPPTTVTIARQRATRSRSATPHPDGVSLG